jgi:ABC-type Na+ efflux pump permease subunit
MKMDSSKFWLSISILLLLTGCATGSSIVVGEARKAIDPEQVKLYLEAPDSFKTIGIVSASSDAGWTEQDSVDYAVEELKNQAAKLGANGVLIVATGENNSTVIGGYGTGYIYAIPVTEKSVTGTAIYVGQ